jgi:hypothetical protein
MDGKNNDREFEQFLKENADNHRLYPADSVWESIHARLHPKKRWPLTALLLLAFTTGSITWFGPGERSIESVRRTDKVEAAVSIVKQSDAPDFASDFTQELTSSEAETEVATLAKTDAFSVAPTEAPTESSPIPASQVEPAIAETAASVSTTAITPNEPSYPLSIESVTNSYQRQKHSPRFHWQFHFTPTVSYRSLKEDQKFIAQARMNLSAAPLAATTEQRN